MVTAHRQKYRRSFSHWWGKAGIYVAFVIFSVIVLLPVYWMVRSSLSNTIDLHTTPLIYFPTPTLQNFQTLVEQVPFFDYTRNSLVFALGTTAVTLLVSYLAAYAFARITFPGSNILMWVLILSMALPEVGTIVPLYRLLNDLHLLDTIAGLTLVLSSVLAPFTVWVLTSFMRALPGDLEEAAYVDGATPIQVFYKVLLPLIAPGLVTTGLLAFISAWNEYLYALSFIQSPDKYTVPLAITSFVSPTGSGFAVPWGQIMAATVIVTLPLLIMVLVLQKRIIAGLTAGAVKG